jgi:hypothetical protein
VTGPTPMNRSHLTLVSCLFIAACLCGGCGGPSAGSVSIPAWQEHVEKYVHDFGKDDPASLREVSLPDGRKGFAVNGSPLPQEAQDVVGLMLAFRPIEGRPSFVYLVGVVDKERVTDIRLALLSIDSGAKFHWSVSPPNASALATYQRFRGAAGADNEKRHPENFPAPQDVFTLTSAEGGRVTAVHAPSGASWTVAVGARAGPTHG